jgi:hypothetical protein
MKEKDIMELGLGSVDVVSITGSYVAKVIDYSAKEQAVFSSLFRPVSIPEGYGKILLPLGKSSITFEIVNEGNTVSTESNYYYNAQTVTPIKYGAILKCDMEAVESPTRIVFDDLLLEGSKEWTRMLEERASTVALDIRSSSITSWSGGTLGSTSLTPIIGITSVTGGTISSVDYYDGKVLLTGSTSGATVAFTYGNRCSTLGTGLVKDATSKGSLTLDDVLSLSNSMTANTVHPDILFVHNIDLRNFAKDTEFQNYLIYGESKRKGFIGRALGLTVVTSGILPEGLGILVDSERLGWDIHKRDLEGIKQEFPSEDRIYYHLWAEREYAIADTLAIGVVTNIKTGLYPATNL